MRICQQILKQPSNTGTVYHINEALLQQEGLEPLTDRELGILRLLEKDFTNKRLRDRGDHNRNDQGAYQQRLSRGRVNNRRAAVCHWPERLAFCLQNGLLNPRRFETFTPSLSIERVFQALFMSSGCIYRCA